MRVLLIVVIASFLIKQSVYAQNDALREKVFELNKVNMQTPVKYLTEKDIEGNPYLHVKFINGTIVKKNDARYTDIPLRFNMYDRSVEFIQDGKVLKIADPQNVDEVLIGENRFIYAPFSVARKKSFSFFEVVCEGKYRLLRMYKMKVEGLDEKTEPYLETKMPQFTSLPSEYFMQYRDGTALQIATKKRLIKILQPVPPKIEEYIRKNDFQVSSENQLIELFEIVNQLM